MTSLNSTWTPLVAGLFVARFGTGLRYAEVTSMTRTSLSENHSSVLTTGCILLGQVILLIGVLTSHIVVMASRTYCPLMVPH